MTLLIGVDGGGTHTRAVVSDANGQVFGRGSSGSSNFYAVGIEGAVVNIACAIREAVSSAGNLEGPSAFSCGLGLAGACSPSEVAALRNALQPVLTPFLSPGAPIAIEEDAVAAWAGAFVGRPGVICIAGTGANVFGIGVDGSRARADGLGPLLGDRGSGIRIGESVLRAACAAFDGAGPQTSLLSTTLAHFGLRTVEELVSHVYAPTFARSDLAGLVRVAAHEAAQGDDVAQGILEAAGRDLAASVLAVMRKLSFRKGKPIPVAPVGGVLENVAQVRESLARHLMSEASLQEPHFESVVGAAFLPLIGTREFTNQNRATGESVIL